MILRSILTFCICFYGTIFNSSIAQQPKLILPKGHTSLVIGASFSPNGKYIVTFSFDGTAKVWNAISGELVSDLQGHTAVVNGASFSFNGKNIVTTSEDNTAKVWDAFTGVLVTTVTHTRTPHDASFSPDGKNIVTSCDDSRARVWNAVNGKLVCILDEYFENLLVFSFSPDGKYILSPFSTINHHGWDAVSGKLKVILSLTNIKNKALSSDYSTYGKYQVVIGEDSTARVLNTVSGNTVSILKGYSGNFFSGEFSPDSKYIVSDYGDSTAKVWKADNGQLVAHLIGHSDNINSVSFSPDGKYIVTTSNDQTAKIWNIVGGKLIANLKGHTSAVINAFFSPKCPNDPIGGKYIATTSWDHTARVWNTTNWQLVSVLKGNTNRINKASFSPPCLDDPNGGKYFAVASGNNTAMVLNTVTGQLVTTLKGHKDGITKLAFSPNGKYILSVSYDSTVKVWNAVSGVMIVDLRVAQDAAFSPACPDDPIGGKYLLTTYGKSAKVRKAANGELIADLKGHSDDINSASFSPDGRNIVTGSYDSTAKVWNTFTGELVADLKGHTGRVFSTSFSPNGRNIVTGSDDSTAKIWNAVSGKLLAELRGHTDRVSNASFSPACSDDSIGGKFIATASRDMTAKIWNTATGKWLADLKGHKVEVTSVSFSPDGKYIISSATNEKIMVWNTGTWQLKNTFNKSESDHPDLYNEIPAIDFKNKFIACPYNSEVTLFELESGKMLYTFLALDSSDYLVYDSQKHYDGTEAARKLLYFTCSDEIISLDQVKDQLWVPNLAERIMNGETIKAKTLNELNICGLTPVVEELTENPGIFTYTIKPRHGGLGETILSVNGNPTKTYQPGDLTRKGGYYVLSIPKKELSPYFIAGANNLVSVKSYTADNSFVSRAFGNIVTNNQAVSKAPPSLYAVMVGVSDYKGTGLDLKYAAKDATDISKALSNAARKLLNTNDSNHVFMYNLTTEKDRFQLPEKNSIKKVFEEIGKKATANDILLVFFAGHGVMTGEGDKKQFYFLTADASNESAVTGVAEVGISTTELIEWMKPSNIKAQKRIMIFDACNSGQAINDLAGKDFAVRDDGKAQQIKAIDKLNEKSGLFILSASTSDQSAYEMGRYAQGLLTYSLLKTIKQQPDILNDGKFLDVSKWFNAAKESVSELAKENKARQEPQIVTNTNFNIGVVDAEVMAKIILPQEKPLFAASNFQNSDEGADGDNLELSKLINLQLADIASRGGESKIVYVMATTSTDAFMLSGRYDVKGNEITIRVSVKKNNETKYRFEEKGTKEKLTELVNIVVLKAADWVSNNK